MTTLQTTLMTPEITVADIPDGSADKRLWQLFNPSTTTSSTEMLVESRISEMIHDFLSTADFSSSIEFKSLVRKFSDSRIPAEPYEVTKYLDRLSDDVVIHSTRTSSPRFIGHMTSALPYF